MRGGRVVEIIEHFSGLGRAFENHKMLEQMLDANAPVLPKKIETAMQRVLRTIEKEGSPELRQEIEPVRETIRSFQGLSLAEAIGRVETMTPAEKGGAVTVVRPRDLAPASRKADWSLIRKHMPPSEGIREVPGR